MWLGGGAMIIGVLLLLLSILPFLQTHRGGPLVLGDNEVFAVTGLIFANLGLLILLQEWFGLV
jgi:hypothetical protein